MLFIDIDPYAPHSEECSFWHGGYCDCKPEAVADLSRNHCHECDFVNAPMLGSCNCRGWCICERLEDCPCIGRGIGPRPKVVVV